MQHRVHIICYVIMMELWSFPKFQTPAWIIPVRCTVRYERFVKKIFIVTVEQQADIREQIAGVRDGTAIASQWDVTRGVFGQTMSGMIRKTHCREDSREIPRSRHCFVFSPASNLWEGCYLMVVASESSVMKQFLAFSVSRAVRLTLSLPFFIK